MAFIVKLTVTIVVLLGVFISPSTPLVVLGVVGGGAVMNGTTPLVVMDCHYKIPPGEQAGLVVTWYHNRNPRPVYQWIPGSSPQGLGMLRDRLDLKYQSSPDHMRQYSALAFVAPTTDLAGDYTCKVATYYAEGRATGRFTVYTPPSEFDMKMSKPSFGKVIIACKGLNAYPEPKVTLFKTDINTQRRTLMESRLQKDYDALTNQFNLTAESSILGHQLIGETQFECVFTIPGTDYRLQENLLYYPGVISSAAAHSGRSVYGGNNGAESSKASALLLLRSSLLLLLAVTWYRGI